MGQIHSTDSMLADQSSQGHADSTVFEGLLAWPLATVTQARANTQVSELDIHKLFMSQEKQQSGTATHGTGIPRTNKAHESDIAQAQSPQPAAPSDKEPHLLLDRESSHSSERFRKPTSMGAGRHEDGSTASSKMSVASTFSKKSKKTVTHDSKDHRKQHRSHDQNKTGFLGITYLPEEECLKVWMRTPRYEYIPLEKCPK